MEGKASSLFRVNSWLIHAAIWRYLGMLQKIPTQRFQNLCFILTLILKKKNLGQVFYRARKGFTKFDDTCPFERIQEYELTEYQKQVKKQLFMQKYYK